MFLQQNKSFVVSADPAFPAVLKKRQACGRHIEIDEINGFPFGRCPEGGKGGRKPRAFTFFRNPEGEKTVGNGDTQSLKHAFDQGSALIVFSDGDHLRTRLPENLDELFRQPLCLQDEPLLSLPEKEIGRNGEVESVAGLVENGHLGISHRRLAKGREKLLREGDALQTSQIHHDRSPCRRRSDGRECTVSGDLRYGDAAFLDELFCLCGEGPFAPIKQEEALAVGRNACRLFAEDEPVGKDEDFRLCSQGQRLVGRDHPVVS